MSYKTLEIPAEPRIVCDTIQYFLSSKCRDWQTGDRDCKLSRPYAKLRMRSAVQRRRYDVPPPVLIELNAQEERRLDGDEWVVNDPAVLIARLTMRPRTTTDWLLDVWPSSSEWQAEAELIDQVVETLQRTRGRPKGKSKMGRPHVEQRLDRPENEKKARKFQKMVAKGKSEQEAADLLGYSRETLKEWCDRAGLKVKKPQKRPKKFYGK